jgi:hypothetical protein
VAKKRNKNTTSGAIHDRTAKSARPWNDPEVVKANYQYGMTRRGFGSYKKVHEFENTIEDKGILDSGNRLTCRPCGTFKNSCVCGA